MGSWNLAIANISFIAILYKELKISTFDTSIAVGVGLMPVLIHYLLMVMVATTAVVAFESVGAILVIAFFIVPASGAYLLTDRLSRMILLSVALGIISAVTGYLFAILADVSNSWLYGQHGWCCIWINLGICATQRFDKQMETNI